MPKPEGSKFSNTPRGLRVALCTRHTDYLRLSWYLHRERLCSMRVDTTPPTAHTHTEGQTPALKYVRPWASGAGRDPRGSPRVSLPAGEDEAGAPVRGQAGLESTWACCADGAGVERGRADSRLADPLQAGPPPSVPGPSTCRKEPSLLTPHVLGRAWECIPQFRPVGRRGREA